MDALYSFIGRVVTLIIDPLITLLMAAALAYFVWSAGIFILNSSKPEEIEKGKQQLIWSVIGLFIMVSVFGILHVALSTFCNPQSIPGLANGFKC